MYSQTFSRYGFCGAYVKHICEICRAPHSVSLELNQSLAVRISQTGEGNNRIQHNSQKDFIWQSSARTYILKLTCTHHKNRVATVLLLGYLKQQRNSSKFQSNSSKDCILCGPCPCFDVATGVRYIRRVK